MKNMKKLFALMLLMASVLFFACSGDEDSKLTKEETKTEITQLSSDLATKLTEMTESDGMVAMEDLMAMPYPFVDGTKSVKQTAVLSNIQKYLLPQNYLNKSSEKSLTEEPFDFDLWVGTYTWDIEHQMWVPDFGNPSDQIIIHFPTEDSNVNNATLTMYKYDDIEVDGEMLPTEIKVDLVVNDIKIIDIDLTAEWFTEGEYMGEPTSLDVSVYLIPFEFTGNFVHNSTVASIDFAINYDGAQFFSAGVDATWTNAGDSIPATVGGYVQFFEVKFEANVNVNGLIAVFNNEENYASEEVMLQAINSEVDAYVTVSGTWAADIEIGLDTNKDVDILFVYADGTSESAIPYFEELGNDLESFFGDLEDYYDSW